MIKNISIKNIVVLLSAILGGAILILFLVWLIGVLVIVAHDKKENKNWAELSYNEQNKKYQISNKEVFKMDYTYDIKTNVGFVGGGGFTENNCWERYIIEAGSDKYIMSISLCQDEKITKEKLDTLNNFWEEYEKVFRIRDRIRDNYLIYFMRGYF